MNDVNYQSQLETILSNAQPQKFSKGQVLHLGGDIAKISFVNDGFVKRYSITSDGDQSIQSIYGPHDIFPLTPVFKLLFNQSIYTGDEILSYEALTPITITTIHLDVLLDAIKEDSNIYKELLFVCGVRLHSNIQRLENISLKTVEQRLAHQLLFFAERFGEKHGSEVAIQIPLTHQTMAYILNVARETVSLNLQRLQEKNLVQTRPQLVITDMDGLRQIATG